LSGVHVKAVWAEFFSDADLVVVYTPSIAFHVSESLLIFIPVQKAASLMSGDILLSKSSAEIMMMRVNAWQANLSKITYLSFDDHILKYLIAFLMQFSPSK
jgi:hypothetical protein